MHRDRIPSAILLTSVKDENPLYVVKKIYIFAKMTLACNEFYSFLQCNCLIIIWDRREVNVIKWNIFSLVTKDANNSLRDHFQDLVSRDQRRFWYADTNQDKMLSEYEFHLFVKPKQYKEMMELVAYVSRYFDFIFIENLFLFAFVGFYILLNSSSLIYF